MAILSKIRERSMFLIIIIGLALFAFVLDPSSIMDFFNSEKVNEIGEVNGETISREEFVTALEQYKQQTGGRVSEMQASKTVWNNLLRKKIYKNQLSSAGITVGEADVWQEIINSPSVKGNPQFLNEAGAFDEGKFKQFLANTKENNPQLWGAWSNYMNQLKDNAESNTYNNLVNAGVGASLKEGEADYFLKNTKLTSQFVFIPYTSISDSLVNVSKADIEAYIKKNESNFKVEKSKDISYVKFDIVATQKDEQDIKAAVASLINNSTDRNNQTIVGLKNATDYAEFLSENDSDINLDNGYKFKTDIASTIANEVIAGEKGAVFGPYKDQNYFKISKITEITQMPDSVKASHILIPFVGAQGARENVVKTEEEAKKLADSLLTIVKKNKKEFGALAKKYSSDVSNSEKEGALDWFNYNRMTPAFRDFCFTNKVGAMDVVKTPFGFHVIKIDETKNEQNVVKLATYGKKIVPSETTENEVFQKTEQFALAAKQNKFTETAKENNYVVKPAIGIKALDENVPGLGNERQIVSWAFGKETKVGDFKRFDLEGSYVVATVTGNTEKGLMSASKASNSVKPILLKEKKAKIIADKMNGATLEEIASSEGRSVRTANNVTLQSPTLSGAGSEPKVVGAMYNAKENKVYKNISGDRGVYAFKVLKKELPTALPNYEASRKRISESRRRLTYKVYEAIKDASKIEDNRASMYGVN